MKTRNDDFYVLTKIKILFLFDGDKDICFVLITYFYIKIVKMTLFSQIFFFLFNLLFERIVLIDQWLNM